MKIALICPSNRLYMPYVDNYTKILDEIHADYFVINWDRFKIEKESEGVYRDTKIGHQRNISDYFKYSRFVMSILKQNNYDRLIVFSIQLAFFLKKYLVNHYKDKYIFDIRDHNRIIKHFNIEKVINSAAVTVLSSPGYKEWLPESRKYLINHNTKIDHLNELQEIKPYNPSKRRKIAIGSIGALRDYKINVDFIESLKDSNKIELKYHGEGPVNKAMSRYLLESGIGNVHLTGRYLKDQEESLYKNCDLINVLRYSDGVNNKTALPNRVYNAPFFGKQMIAYEGTQLSDLVKKYSLGMVADSFEGMEEAIVHYLNNFNEVQYHSGRERFFRKVIDENRLFRNYLEGFGKGELTAGVYNQDLR